MSAISVVVLLVVLFLAFSNGANDNFKGVATIYGSRTASYRTALAWATVTTLAGSLLALVLAAQLVKTFSAKGLVPATTAADPTFLAAAALGAALTVLLATRFGMPVSTTHALTGALIGAGLAARSGVAVSVLGKSFFLPLLASPVLAITIAVVLYPLARFGRRRLGIERTSCVCVDREMVPVTVAADGTITSERVRLAITAGATCVDRYEGRLVGISARHVLDVLHFLSAGAVCFARGLNDTPKIVGILLGAKALGAEVGLPAIGAAMAIGGLVGAKRVAETMATKIVSLNAGQGFIANLTTASLVIGASILGSPVSTTHVATGALFGIGAVTGTARWKTIATILVAWATTLPLGALGGALAFVLLRIFIV